MPNDILGKIISIADKLDSVVGSYGIGVTPKGSKDPFALRRMMISILSILLTDGKNRINLDSLIDFAIKIVADRCTVSISELANDVKEAFKQRLRTIMNEKGYRYDVIESEMDESLRDLQLFLMKCDALNTCDVGQLNSIHENILRTIKLSNSLDETGAVNTELLTLSAEIDMYNAALSAQESISNLISNNDYSAVLDILFSLGNDVAKFLTDVMVMDENQNIRENRMRIMKICAKSAAKIADFEKLRI